MHGVLPAVTRLENMYDSSTFFLNFEVVVDQDTGEWLRYSSSSLQDLKSLYMTCNIENRVGPLGYLPILMCICDRTHLDINVCGSRQKHWLMFAPQVFSRYLWLISSCHSCKSWGKHPFEWARCRCSCRLRDLLFFFLTVYSWIPQRVSTAGVERSKVPLHDPACLFHRLVWIIVFC